MITIVLPPPDPRLHAHNSGSWKAKAKPTRELRELACLLARRELSAGAKPLKRASVEYRFYFPVNRRRDAANAIQATKPAIDGCVDAGLLPDDDWGHLAIGCVISGIDADNPRTELIFTERSWAKK